MKELSYTERQRPVGQLHSVAYRAGVGVALAAVFILIWANGAVGIIGTKNNSANLMYGGVLTIGVIGTILARLQPWGMARTLYAMVFAQVVVAVIALVGGWVPRSQVGHSIP